MIDESAMEETAAEILAEIRRLLTLSQTGGSQYADPLVRDLADAYRLLLMTRRGA